MPYGPNISIDEIMQTLRPFGGGPLILKDYVKSQKHYWNEACFIPSAADARAVEKVVQRFVELQGDDLNEGLVFREYVELEPLAKHSKSGMPLTLEYRIFFVDGEPVYKVEYWEEGIYLEDRLSINLFKDLGQKIKSRFFTMDVAKQLDGEWIVVELGDGQVAGLPANAEPLEFFKAIQNRIEAT
jgi:hypothetical protein